MKNFNSKLEEYITLKAQVDILNKQLDALKKEFLEDLKSRECAIDEKGNLIFTHAGANYTITLNICNTLNVDTAAVKKAFPGQFLKPGTRENFSIKAN